MYKIVTSSKKKFLDLSFRSKNIKQLVKQKEILFLLISLWIALEYIGIGPFSYIRIHDSGDSHIPRQMAMTTTFFKHGINYWFPYSGCGVDSLANNIKHSSFMGILFGIFPGWLAYQIIILTQLFLGSYFTYRLCKDHLQISDVCSVCAGVIFGLSSSDLVSLQLGIAGFPLILWAFEKIVNSTNRLRYLWIFLLGLSYSFCSNLVATIPYILIMAFLYFVFIRRKADIKFLILFIVFCIAMFLPQFNNIWSMFLNASLSHRADYGLFATQKGPISVQTYFYILQDGVEWLLNSKLALLLAFIGLAASKFRSRLLLISFSFFLFCTVGTSGIKLLAFSLREYITFFRSFPFDRFYFVAPFFAALSASYSLESIRHKLKNWVIERKALEKTLSWRAFNIFMIIVFASLFFLNFLTKYKHMSLWLYQGSYIYNYKSEELQKLSLKAKNELFRAASIYPGLHPACLNVYGLETVGGYLNMYPKSYQKFWGKVIEPLTEKEDDIYYYFNYFGHRIYLFCPKDVKEIIFDKYYRLNLLSLANTRYIISKIPIIDKRLNPILAQKISWRSLPKIKRGLINIEANFKGIKYLYIYENKAYFPRFFLAKNIKTFKNSPDLLKHMSLAKLGFLRDTVHIEKKHLKNIELNSRRYENAHIEIDKYTPDKIELSVALDGSGILVASNNYSPYWKCKVNDIETDIFPTYSTFWGIFLTKAAKKIIFYYDPPYSAFK